MDLKEYIQNNKADFDDQNMPDHVDDLFKNKLKSELHSTTKTSHNVKLFLSIAASLVIIVSSLIWINSQRTDAKERATLISNLSNESTGKRLEAVYEFSDDYQKEDEEIINVLITKLLNDENANVKIATIEALLQFPQNETIRKSLIKALEQETTPLVQIRLIDAMSTLRENRAQNPLKKLIENDNTFDIVKNKAHLAMADLNPQK